MWLSLVRQPHHHHSAERKAPPQPPPVNPALPPPPQVGLIVDASDPAYYPSVITYTMPDNDVAAISTSSLAVTNYYPHLGTDQSGFGRESESGNLYVANTDALNLIMFETALNGHIVNHQITSVNPTTGQTQIFDLNPGIDYSQLPNPAAVATALAMPTAIVPNPPAATSISPLSAPTAWESSTPPPAR
jgi:hypothetical protein